jgi:ABC-2 type transport system permease protein
MRNIWLIGLQSLQLLVKDKTAFIWFLIIPFVYIFVFGNINRGGSDPSEQRAYLAVENHDAGFLAQQLIDGLRSENIHIDSLAGKPDYDPARILTIPENFTKNLLKGEKVELIYSKRTDTNLEAAMTASMGIRKAYFRLLADLAESAVKGKKKDKKTLQAFEGREPFIKLKTEYAGRHVTIPRGFNQVVPANIVQFSLLMVFIYAGSAIIEEKRNGLLRRIRICPVSHLDLFLGKLLNVLFLGLVQIILLMCVGHFVFGVYYGNAPLAMMLLIIAYCLAIGTMGLCLGFFINQPEKLLGAAIISGLIMAALSGCWWPLEITPVWTQRLAMVLPSGLALKAFHQLISFGKGLESVWPYILALLGFTILFSSIFATRLARYQES